MSINSFTSTDLQTGNEESTSTLEIGQKRQSPDETRKIPSEALGQKLKGKVYESRPVDSTLPDIARFRDLLMEHEGDHLQAARCYFLRRSYKDTMSKLR